MQNKKSDSDTFWKVVIKHNVDGLGQAEVTRFESSLLPAQATFRGRIPLIRQVYN